MRSSVSVLIGGSAGQGIASIETLLTKGFKRGGFYTFSTKEFMSRVRGGSNTTLIRISDKPVNAPDFKVDIFVPLDTNAFFHAQERITNETFVVAKKGDYECDCVLYDYDLENLAKEIGNPIVSNTIAAAFIFGLLGCDGAVLREIVAEFYTDELLEVNLKALEIGSELARENGNCRYCIAPNSSMSPKNDLFLSGTDGVGFGAIAGGCNFISSYPMSPSTGVLTFLAKQSRNFGICVEQAEDEIAAFQMGLGVWYGGGRAITTTSGGGFALMGEGLSLSGITETPMVVYLAQRPGPATGLPTRTEQGDLELAIYSGHGEFPRIVLAPGDPKECFELARKAFELADAYQVPVILMSDQYLADSYFTVERFEIDPISPPHHIVKTDADYKRYLLTPEGISPRGIPGYGEGLVLVDSDEHSEEGLITESMSVRNEQHTKRLQKRPLVEKEAILPDVEADGDIAVVGWGSTKYIIKEAVERIADKRLSTVHFSWVYPLSEAQLAPLQKAKRLIVVENNATGQFAKLLRLHGISVDAQILKSDGLSFFVDELSEKIALLLKEIR
ncbi:MAG: 2-oxoacid:acceptor oxidoreductase subunit alpha [Sulfuricurvum sp.]|uniref:2-oxoacid:acceptor oxidoreductase subunit alpha n=1 Tax=Sulfuricurvum sp. TaxID=2025608 RepID=UPI0027342873|nr:2-oxoacid:acceptor oxidoreductase subunit alpha [Sulfuricurvum sp.]MDP2850405.1 2-oxoacid:acceptor oxidoreductase subunit alpha [Sulfuricurvum sp.]